jgi:hypothetical protein
MNNLSLENVSSLTNNELVTRMDEIINSGQLSERGNKILQLEVSNMMNTEKVKNWSNDFQRKIAYKTFQTLWQLRVSEFKPIIDHGLPGDKDVQKQFDWLTNYQWVIISSRIVFECLRDLIYMIDKGKPLEGGKTKKIKSWLKEENNNFKPLAILLVRGLKFSRLKREPEIHNNSNYSNKLLSLSVAEIDNSVFSLTKYIKQYWGDILKMADGQNFGGYPVFRDEFDDKEWYQLIKEGDINKINNKIDEMFEIVESAREGSD